MPARPPKKFFYRILKKTKEQYPNLPPARQAKIAASVFHKLSPRKKAELVRREKHNPEKFKVPYKVPYWAQTVKAPEGFGTEKRHKMLVLKAIKSKKTPPHLRKALIKYARKRGWL